MRENAQIRDTQLAQNLKLGLVKYKKKPESEVDLKIRRLTAEYGHSGTNRRIRVCNDMQEAICYITYI
jgi:hypothetical protein